MKACGHDPNPPDDVDHSGRPYESCYFCFIQDLEEFQDWYESLKPKEQREIHDKTPLLLASQT